tara:strand:- start:368 stop:1453 length:1086 start_codon:yes stop_codon:yes gene_type:complete
MYNKIYLKHIYNIYISRFIIVTLVFSSLIFVLNILEEIKFFNNSDDIGIGFPILLTILNLPSILYEIFPFIILITTQFFFIKFQNNAEILIFKNNGINNLKIISHLCLLVFIIGIFLVFLFHLLSSSMKHTYLELKNKYTQDNKYLAVINENGLWIKDKLDNKTVIIHSEKIEKNILKNIVITTFDENFVNLNNIIGKEAVIKSNIWDLNEVILIDNFGKKDELNNLKFETNFDYLKINSLFSNLESLSIFQLYKQKKDFKSVGLSVKDIDIYLNKIFSLPVSLVIYLILSSILMLNINYNKSKTFVLIIGILLSVVIYYVYYFFGLLGSSNKVPTLFAIWLPNLILFLSCMIGIVNINEK